MKLRPLTRSRSLVNAMAASLIEVLVCVSIVGVMFTSLYGGITQGFGVISAGRENLRASQILLEVAEIMRTYTWQQVNSNGFVPTNFTEAFFPTNISGINNTNPGLLYYGTVEITDPGFSASYSNGVKKVTITLNWTNGSFTHERSIQTYVSEHGMQNYFF